MIHTFLVGFGAMLALVAILFACVCLVSTLHEDAPVWMRVIGGIEALLCLAYALGLVVAK